MAEAKRLDLRPKDKHFETDTLPQPGCFVDSGTSAFSVKLERRPAGQELLAALETGDTLIVAKIDRAFRSVKDFITVTDHLSQNGVRLVCVSPKVDMGTAFGRALAMMLATLAEWESSRKGERIRNALAAKATKELAGKVKSKEYIESLPSEYRPLRSEFDLSPVEFEPGRIFVYTRVSHRTSTESGLGILHQMQTAAEYVQRLKDGNVMLEDGGCSTDSSVSAVGMPFKCRPAGHDLHDNLRRGDHVVFASLDRGFRDITDMATTLPQWEAMGVHVHFVEEGIVMDEPEGRLMAHAATIFASYEAEIIATRNREMKAVLAAKGAFLGGSEPTFWRLYKARAGKSLRKTKQLILDRRKIIAFRLVSFIHFHTGKSYEKCFRRAEELYAMKASPASGRPREDRRTIPQFGMEGPQAGRLIRIKAKDPIRYLFRVDERKRVFPLITTKNWLTYVKHYDRAIEQWRKIAATRRALLEGQNIDVQPLHASPMAIMSEPRKRVLEKNQMRLRVHHANRKLDAMVRCSCGGMK
jgi:DNA invertase Pin-like site-specific DNA recombinase